MTSLFASSITAGLNLRQIGTKALFLTLAIAGSSDFAFSQHVYLANRSANTLSAYSVGRAGTLTATPGSPFATGVSPAAVAADPASRFVYVANSDSNDISAYTIDADTGSLTPVKGSPFAAGVAPVALSVDAAGKFVYVADGGSNDVSAFSIDPATGALSPVSGSPFAAGAAPAGIAVGSTGRFAYVTNSGSGSISAYSIDSSSGALTPVSGSPFAAGKDADSVTLDPAGKFAYVASLDVSDRSIWAFAIDEVSGELSPVAGSPFAIKGGAVSLQVHPSGKFLYVASGSEVSTYALDSITGALALVPTSRFAAGLRSAMVMDATGQFVYGADESADGLSAFAVDSSTGTLTPVRGASFGRLRSNAVAGKAAVAIVNRGPLDAGGPLITAFTPGTLRNNFTGGFGMKFTVGASPVSVTALGRIYIDGNTQSHVVKLVNASDSSDVPGGSVTVSLPSGTPGQFVYVPLASPVTLAANTSYYLITLETNGGDQFYDASPVTPAPVATVDSAVVFWPGVGFLQVGTANLSSGLVNLLYGTASAPPSVAITSPAAGPVSGNNVTLSATASAAPGLTIASVQFQVDNVNFGAPITSPPYSTVLDTTKLTNGPHTVRAIATDSANNSTPSAPVSITVGNTATTVSVIAPVAGSTISGNNVMLTATATPGSGLTITSVQFKVDNVNVGAPVTTSPYTTVLDATKLANGPHTIVAVATDSSGMMTPSAPISVTVNNTVTTVTVTSPLAGTTVSGSNVALTASAVPGTGLTILNVQFKVDNVNQGAPVTTSPYGTLLDTTMLSNGPHTVIAVATDSSNMMTASLPVSFIVNNGGPPPPSGTPLITAFAPGAPRNNFTGGFGMQFTVGPSPLSVTALGRIYIAGNTQSHVVKLVRASDSTDVPGGSVTISLPSGAPGQFAYASLASPVTLAANTAYYLVTLETNGGDQFYDAGPVTPTGAATVNSAVVFAPGIGYIPVGTTNLSSGPVNLLYVAPGAPPSVAITAPVAGSTVSGNSVPVSASATAGPGLTIASVQFQLDNVNLGGPITTAPYSTVLDTTKLSNGPHTLTATATDSASNSITSTPVSFTVNNTATTVSISSPVAGSTVSGSSVPVTVTVTPGTGLTILKVQYKLDNVDFGAPITTAPYSTVLDSTKLTNGPHSLVAVVTDSSNMVITSTPVSFTVNNTTTSVTIIFPAPGATVSGNSVPVTATATPGTGLTILNVQFKVDGNNFGAPATMPPYGALLDTTTLSDGNHTLLAVATDSSNAMVSSAPVTINVLNGGPPPTGTPLITAFTPGNPRNDSTGGFGMKFTVGPTSINVTALGRIYITGNSGSHVVKLVNLDGTDVPGASVTVTLPSGVPDQFAYVALPTPVTLGANTAYYLISQETAGGDAFYNLGPVTSTSAVTVNSGVVFSPLLGIVPVGPANYAYVPANLLYTTGP